MGSPGSSMLGGAKSSSVAPIVGETVTPSSSPEAWSTEGSPNVRTRANDRTLIALVHLILVLSLSSLLLLFRVLLPSFLLMPANQGSLRGTHDSTVPEERTKDRGRAMMESKEGAQGTEGRGMRPATIIGKLAQVTSLQPVRRGAGRPTLS